MYAIAMQLPDGSVTRVPMDFEPKTEIVLLLTTRLTKSILRAMVSTDNSLRETAARACAKGFANVWKVKIRVEAVNKYPFLTGTRDFAIALSLTVWQPRVLVGTNTDTGATLQVCLLPCKQDCDNFRAFNCHPHDSKTQAHLVASALLDRCITPNCEGAVWGSYHMCSKCIMCHTVNY